MNKQEVQSAVREVFLTYTDPAVLPNGRFQLNTNATIVVGQDVNITKVDGASLTLGQKIAAESIPVVLPSGVETPAAVTVGIGVGAVAAGKLQVKFITDSSFTGTILGAAVNASQTYPFEVMSPGKTLAAIAYEVTAGSMVILMTS